MRVVLESPNPQEHATTKKIAVAPPQLPVAPSVNPPSVGKQNSKCHMNLVQSLITTAVLVFREMSCNGCETTNLTQVIYWEVALSRVVT